MCLYSNFYDVCNIRWFQIILWGYAIQSEVCPLFQSGLFGRSLRQTHGATIQPIIANSVAAIH